MNSAFADFLTAVDSVQADAPISVARRKAAVNTRFIMIPFERVSSNCLAEVASFLGALIHEFPAHEKRPFGKQVMHQPHSSMLL